LSKPESKWRWTALGCRSVCVRGQRQKRAGIPAALTGGGTSMARRPGRVQVVKGYAGAVGLDPAATRAIRCGPGSSPNVPGGASRTAAERPFFGYVLGQTETGASAGGVGRGWMS